MDIQILPAYAAAFVDALNEKFAADTRYTFEYMKGRKYDRIVRATDNVTYGRSVYCFIEKETGAVWKAGGWKAPQPNGIRYCPQSEEDLAAWATENADLYGACLYVR